MLNEKEKFSALNEEIQIDVYTSAKHCIRSKGIGEIELGQNMQEYEKPR